MKQTLVCCHSCLMMLLMLCWLPAHWVSQGHWKYTRDHPRLPLPEASASEYIDRCHGAAAYVSLDSARGWAISGTGFVTEDELGVHLTKEAELWNDLGWRPYLRVRIPANQPARHFLRLHKIATDAGIEDFLFATFAASEKPDF
ncbi:hypothetical protein [Luteolibacter marinus]|uniref:hypothetical protein n=1 Tax=Luteolibacter marinus TaxID=2776705 RepID=UPI00186857A9|nr:hypothetical protein [Luteolibacter marinus]